MYCKVLFYYPVWLHTLADQVRETIDKNTLEYILVICPVAYKYIVPQCFIKLRGSFIRRLTATHHIDVCFYDYIVRCVRFKQKADSLTVRRYCALLLTLMPLSFQCNACVECVGSGVLHKKRKIQRDGPSCTAFNSHAEWKADRKVRPEVGLRKSNIWDLSCTCKRLANLLTLQMASSS